MSKHPYPLLKFSHFQRPFKGTSKCLYFKVFRIELRSECVDTKNLEFFHGMFLHSSVAMETCFGQLGLYLENIDS